MHLIIDVGNTTTNISVFSEDRIISSLTFLTPKNGDFDNEKEEIRFEDLPDDWKCPMCGVGKELFEKI